MGILASSSLFLPEQGSRIVDGTAVLLKYHYDLITLYEYWSKCVLVNDYRIYKKMAEKVVTVGELLKNAFTWNIAFHISHLLFFIFLLSVCVQQLFYEWSWGISFFLRGEASA